MLFPDAFMHCGVRATLPDSALLDGTLRQVAERGEILSQEGQELDDGAEGPGDRRTSICFVP